jgi:hypothetical protein
MKPLILMFLIIIVIFSSGYLIGYAVHGRKKTESDNRIIFIDNDEKTSENYLKILNDDINIENVKRHLKYLSSVPHLAGTDGDKNTADYIYDQFKSYGLDSVNMNDYDVYLDFSDQYNFNKYFLLLLFNYFYSIQITIDKKVSK